MREKCLLEFEILLIFGCVREIWTGNKNLKVLKLHVSLCLLLLLPLILLPLILLPLILPSSSSSSSYFLLPLPPLLHVCPSGSWSTRCQTSVSRLSLWVTTHVLVLVFNEVTQLEAVLVACRLAPCTCYTSGGRRSNTVWPSVWAGIFVFTGSRAILAPTLQLSMDRVALSGKGSLYLRLTALLYLALRQRTRGATPRLPHAPSCRVAKCNTEIIFFYLCFFV